jgi:hypothetical protein
MRRSWTRSAPARPTPAALGDITALAQRAGLRVPPVVTRFDPYGGPPREVDVSRVVSG